jgi:hypothetical protein
MLSLPFSNLLRAARSLADIATSVVLVIIASRVSHDRSEEDESYKQLNLWDIHIGQ